MKVLQINSVSNSGSTGKIVEGISMSISRAGGKSFVGYGRKSNGSKTAVEYRIGGKLSIYWHVLLTRFFDAHGFGSKWATKSFLKKINKEKPDLVHIHNIHGYYLNVKLFFDYLKKQNIPVVWTLHDCWPFTGHCAYYTATNCAKWQSGCSQCPISNSYPESFFDNSKMNYLYKKRIFSDIQNLTVVTPSNWLSNEVQKSFLGIHPRKVINNGINLSVFKPVKNYDTVRKSYNLNDKFVILGVASEWDKRKGFEDFILLSKLLSDDFKLVLVGVDDEKIKILPRNIIGIKKTENQHQLAELYSAADVYFNPTYEDNFPTTNLESLACGTPVVTYNTGGSPEAVTIDTGRILDVGSINQAFQLFEKMLAGEVKFQSLNCRKRAELHYDQEERFNEYTVLYKQILNL